MEIISLEKGKVSIFSDKVIKKTSIDELKHLLLANEIINRTKLKINNKYKLCVPKVFSYHQGNLTMERCFGNNLELMLRNIKTHDFGVKITNDLLKFLLDNNIYWQDFAPRNVLIDNDTISIMDFERGISDTYENLSDYFANSVYEEYGAFLLPEERIISVNDALSIKTNHIININNIQSKRVKTILKLMGFTNDCFVSDYYEAVKMIIKCEEPYKIKDEIIFPLIELEKYIKENGYEKYSRKIIGDANVRKI